MSNTDTEALGAATMKQQIRIAIANAYYEARNSGRTMEDAATTAATRVIRIIEAQS